MPSFFYHLAFDLDALPPSRSETPQKQWEAFPLTVRAGNRDQQAQARVRASQESKSSSNEELGVQGHNQAAAALSNPDQAAAGLNTAPAIIHDWRYGTILTQGIEMAPGTKEGSSEAMQKRDTLLSNGISAGPSGLATKGRFEPSTPEEEELGWGVIRLYRDGEETPGLYDKPTTCKSNKAARGLQRKDAEKPAFKDEDCTTLCILAVPSYLTPSDFLGFVGERTREEVSHFRMIRTERSNRYMVLMKFRNGKKAREWRIEWNGKAFDGIEPETAHVVFISSITFLTPSHISQPTSYPTTPNDPFTPSQPSTSTRPSTTSKPLAPPTPSLIELPTCPVCLERMDESTGLLTILCQHVFHCSCLQKWRGSGCPVCRYTQKAELSKTRGGSSSFPSSLEHDGNAAAAAATNLNECSVCRSEANLWICLICGSVGCGRYDAAHAFRHFEASGHAFAMDLSTQRVWDYNSDSYVHRLVQNAHDGKLLVDLSSSHGGPGQEGHAQQGLEYTDAEDDYDDFVPRSKLHNAGIEYTALLTSQLDSQRMYFEGVLERAADKASLASQAAEKATARVETLQSQLDDLQLQHAQLSHTMVPDLEKSKSRAEKKAEKFETMARGLGQQYREEKTVTESLMARIKHLDSKVEDMARREEALRGEKAEAEETVRDLMFSLSGGRKIAEMGEEVAQGAVSLPVPVPGPPVQQRGEEAGGKKKRKGKK